MTPIPPKIYIYIYNYVFIGNQSIMHMLAMAHEVSLAPMRAETDSNEK